MNIRDLILARLDDLGWSHYRLVKELAGKVPPSPVYAFLRGQSAINSDHLGHVLDAVGLDVDAKDDKR